MDKQAVGLARRAFGATLRAMELRSFGEIQAAQVNEARAAECVRGMVRDFGVPKAAAEMIVTYAETGCEWEETISDAEAHAEEIRASTEGGVA